VLRVQTELECVDYLCLSADGSLLAVSQIARGREVWAAPFGPGNRIRTLAEPRWPGTGPVDKRRKSWWPGAMCKLVFAPTGELLEADALATVPFLVDPREPGTPDENPPLEEAQLQDFCLSADGSRLLTATGNVEGSEFRGYLQCWSRSGTTWERLWNVASENFDLHAVAFLPSAPRVLVAEENVGRDPDRWEMGKYSSVLTLRDERTGELIADNSGVWPFDEDECGFQQFAVGGVEPVAVLGYGRQLHVYNTADIAAEPQVIRTEWPSLRGMAFHPSGRFLLTVAGGPSISVWDTGTWKVVREFDWGIGNLRSVGASRDGLLVAVGSERGIVTIWDWETGQP
jgi:WD40 repeat protein